MKFSLKTGYWNPTPKKIRKLADAVLAACLTVAGFEGASGSPLLGLTIAIVGGIAKFLSNFFEEDPKPEAKPDSEPKSE